MDFTSIHVYGNVLSDEVLSSIVNDADKFEGNSDRDFFDSPNVSRDIDYCWTSLRRDYSYFNERQDLLQDIYGTARSRKLMEKLFVNLGYNLVKPEQSIAVNEVSYSITYQDRSLNDFPVIVVGNVVPEGKGCSLDMRVKGNRKQRSPHATMLAYLNNTEHTYGIIANGQTIRLLRSSGQLVKLSYIEFDLKKMIEEDKYSEFCLLYRILHASRFVSSLSSSCIFERWFNSSIESGNRIRAGLAHAVQQTMKIIANAALQGEGEGNEELRNKLANKILPVESFNKELIHLIYRLLFLFIIEDRKLIFALEGNESKEQLTEITYHQDIYYAHYSASRLRRKSELGYLRNADFHDLWDGLMQDTFGLFESGSKGEPLGIKPLGGKLFGRDTLANLKKCTITNQELLTAFESLDQFLDDKGSLVRINYSSLNVEEFGSVYEGILELHPVVVINDSRQECSFSYKEELLNNKKSSERNSTSSYYTRPDLVQALIKTTLEPVIQERLQQHQGHKEKQIRALLSMRVCDPSCGSGHFVLAMARTIAWYVSQLRTDEDNPASSEYRHALREVISKCVYAVDLNPDAVELCKVVLWIEGYCAGKPLSFLDHHIRCGNSVLGLGNDFNMLLNGVPNEVFNVSNKNKEVKKFLLNFNKQAHKHYVESYQSQQLGDSFALQGSLFATDNSKFNIESTLEAIGSAFKILSDKQGNTEEDELAKGEALAKLKSSDEMKALYNAANIYTYAFFREFTENDLPALKSSDTVAKGNLAIVDSLPYTATVFKALEEVQAIRTNGDSYHSTLNSTLVAQAQQAAQDYKFFHWALEFPDVYANGGFDVMCGNPPWDIFQFEEAAWAINKGLLDIANADSQSKRKAELNKLNKEAPDLYIDYERSKKRIEQTSLFLRKCGRFALTAVGKIDLSSLFAELVLYQCNSFWGLIIPTTIATADGNKEFFQKLTNENRLSSIYDFENSQKIFDIHRSFRFCLLSAHKAQSKVNDVSVGFMLTELEHILDKNRIFVLKASDFAKFNPNTQTCPVFRTNYDAKLCFKIYDQTSIMMSEENELNPWRIIFGSTFNMATKSDSFKSYNDLQDIGALQEGSNFKQGDNYYVPLLEAKMFWQYNHHFTKYPIALKTRPNTTDVVSTAELADTNLAMQPWYWVSKGELDNKIEVSAQGKCKFAIGFRDITNATNKRTCICTLVPLNVACGNTIACIYSNRSLVKVTCLLALLNSLPLDYVAKNKISSTHMNLYIVKQFPVPRPDQIDEATQWQMVKRVAELTYFNHDMDDFAKELSEQLSDEQNEALGGRLVRQDPWIFNEPRRAVVQAELDAIVAKLYGLNDEEVRYILDPEDVIGKGCINETFRVLKESEIKELGEYRTKRLVLEAWDKLKQGLLD